MKLSQFDLAWYARWGISHEPLDEWSRPGLTNFLGSLQAAGDPTSVRHVIFPPVSSAEESTCYLTINGTFLNATRLKTEVRWTPWAIEREAQWQDWKIESRLCMVPDTHAMLQRITVTNTSKQAQTANLGFRISGRCVNRGLEPWYWSVPGVSLSVTDLLHHSGLNPEVSSIDTYGKCFKERSDKKTTNPHVGHAYNAQGFAPAPHRWERNGDAGFTFEIAAGASQTVTFGLALDATDSAKALLRSVLDEAETHFKKAEADWRALWKNAFTPGGALSGCLPDLDLPESLLPVAASGVLSALQSRRTHRAADGKALYNISTPRRVEACFYPNDWSMASRTLAQMDPEATWHQLEIALKADVRKFNQISFFTGKGGDGAGKGWPYTVDIYNLFYAAWYLWQQAGATVAMMEGKQFATARGEMNLLGVLEDLAFDWRTRKVDSLGLADYGPKEELLECVSTYEHVVAAVNAGAVWMLRRLADVYRTLDRTQDAQEVDCEADALRDALLKHLYVEGCGWFRCLNPEGRAREVRHCWDTGMVLMCIGTELPAQVTQEIVRFFKEELQTPGWIRALSPQDGDAAVSGMRADHQFNGAFGSWPAEVALGLVRIGETELAKEWLEGIARTARQGPFAQAYYDEGAYPATLDGATKVTDELPQCCHWSNISGALFFSVMEELQLSTI